MLWLANFNSYISTQGGQIYRRKRHTTLIEAIGEIGYQFAGNLRSTQIVTGHTACYKLSRDFAMHALL